MLLSIKKTIQNASIGSIKSKIYSSYIELKHHEIITEVWIYFTLSVIPFPPSALFPSYILLNVSFLIVYKDLNLDPSISTTDFIKKSITNKESYRLKGVDYIFMSLKAGNFRHTFNPNSNKLIICPEENLNHPK